MPALKLFNTLSRKKEIFRPLRKGRVGLYTCGPTVYNFAHIGNLRTYIWEDILRRTLEYIGYQVRHVMNITDVGHLTSDADTGEDKLEKEAKKENKSVWNIAKFYTNFFLKDIAKLNIEKAGIIAPATKNIKEQENIIKELFKKGLAYETPQAVYFDIAKFKNYTKFSKQKLSQKIVGARKEIVVDSEKINPHDFALWFKLVGHFKNHAMRWPSPWGDGFPGWHIECSAISTKYLGQPFDIHTGAIEHIPIHHTNEIAQSEGAYGKPLARFWLHGEFLLINKSKMAKAKKNFITLDTLVKKDFNPLAFRYLTLTAHYRSKLNFTWESLQAAQNSLERLYDFTRNLKSDDHTVRAASRTYTILKNKFEDAIYNDLDTPAALAVVWNLIHNYNKNPGKFDPKKVLNLLYGFDKILGLGLKNLKIQSVPKEVSGLAQKREEYREDKKWKEADEIRKKILLLGYLVEDTAAGTKIRKK